MHRPVYHGRSECLQRLLEPYPLIVYTEVSLTPRTAAANDGKALVCDCVLVSLGLW